MIPFQHDLSTNCPSDAIHATKWFDILGWWMDAKHVGKWILLQSSVVVHVGQPYTNAAVERVFSQSTWADAARAHQVLECTFEMRVLDANNRYLVEMAKPLLDKKKAFQESFMAVNELVKRFAIPLEDGKEEDKDSEMATAYSTMMTKYLLLQLREHRAMCMNVKVKVMT
jgi:hypothetical protein